ncbi:MAG: hypothetical protein RJA22_3059 [Verrucomicrobiota bacterium]
MRRLPCTRPADAPDAGGTGTGARIDKPMKHDNWLHGIPWDSVITLNQELCQAQQLTAATRTGPLAKAAELWEKTRQRGLPLLEALDLCRQCHAFNALVFNNGNTFAAITRRILEEPLKSISPVDAQILRTTAGHYATGLIGRRELRGILDHYSPAWTSSPTQAAAPHAVSTVGLKAIGGSPAGNS